MAAQVTPRGLSQVLTFLGNARNGVAMDHQHDACVTEYRCRLDEDFLGQIPAACASAGRARRQAYFIGIFITACVLFQFLLTT